MVFAVDHSHVVGVVDLMAWECCSQLKQFCISLRKYPPSLSSASRKCWSSNWTWYSNPSQKPLILSIWVLIVSWKVSLSSCPVPSTVGSYHCKNLKKDMQLSSVVMVQSCWWHGSLVANGPHWMYHMLGQHWYLPAMDWLWTRLLYQLSIRK